MITLQNVSELYPWKMVSVVDDWFELFDIETAKTEIKSYAEITEQIKQEQGTQEDEQLNP